MYIKCQPVQQQRRMAVVGDTLVLHARTGRPCFCAWTRRRARCLRTYENTSPTQEVAYDQGILYLNVGDRFSTAAYDIVKLKDKPFVEGVDPSEPFYGGGFKEGYAPEIEDKMNPSARFLRSIRRRASSFGPSRTFKTTRPASLSIKGDYAVYQAANGLFCVDSKTGESIWSAEKSIANAVGHDSLTPGTTPNTVVITDDKVFAVEGNTATTRATANRAVNCSPIRLPTANCYGGRRSRRTMRLRRTCSMSTDLSGSAARTRCSSMPRRAKSSRRSSRK